MNKRLLLLVIIVVALGLFFWWRQETKPVDSKNTEFKTVVIKNGTSTHEIAAMLQKGGLIKSPLAFILMVRKLGLEGKIQAGDFKISPSENLEAVIKSLIHGSLDASVTIPEGYRAEQIADVLKNDIPTYQPSWRDKLAEKEGYLFPDTYFIPKDADIDTIINTLSGNFDAKYEAVHDGRKTSLSENQIVTIASMVEREAKFQEDRPLVASVILNRLKIGMPLQIDATIQYALGYQSGEKTWWKKNLTTDDLHIQSPYNTYTNPGLPPTPIANPGADALRAVIDAPQTMYLYYVSDKSGHNHYAATLDEQNANIRKYGL